MKSIQALRERRSAKAQEARKLLDENTGEKWTGDVKGKVDAIYNEIGAIDEQIAAHQRQLELEADDPQNTAGAQPRKEAYDEKDPQNRPRILLDRWVRFGNDAITRDDWTFLANTPEWVRARNSGDIKNTMSTTTPSEGGYTVPATIASTVIEAQKAFGAMRKVAEVFKTADGRAMSWPTSDGTSEVGEIIAQNTTATGADPTFGTVSLNVFKYSSKIIAVPWELLQDTTIDMEGFVRRRIARRLGRIGNQHFSTGGGTTLPDGVVPRSSAGKVGTTGQTLTIIYDDLVDMVHSVDAAYREGGACSWVANDNLVKVIRKLKDTAGRPIWIPSYDAGIARAPGGTSGGVEGEDRPTVFDYLLNYPLYVNNDYATPAANAKSMTFGDHSFYKIRDTMEMQLFRFTDSAYTKLGQVGFLAWARMGGNLVDAGAVKYYQHSAT